MNRPLKDALEDISGGWCYCTECLSSICPDDAIMFFYWGMCGACVARTPMETLEAIPYQEEE